jgi:hypothetical protein
MFLIFMLYLLYSSSHYYFRVNLDYEGREHVTTCWGCEDMSPPTKVSRLESGLQIDKTVFALPSSM